MMSSEASTYQTDVQRKDGQILSPQQTEKIIFEPIKLEPVLKLDDMEAHVLTFQNKKLEQRIEKGLKDEEVMEQRVQDLETQQEEKMCLLNLVNRYWNQLNDKLGLILQKLDAGCETIEGQAAKPSTPMSGNHNSDSQRNEEVQTLRINVVDIVQLYESSLKRMTQTRSKWKATNIRDRNFNANHDSETESVHSLSIFYAKKYQKISLKEKELQDHLSTVETRNSELQTKIVMLKSETSRLTFTSSKAASEIQALTERCEKLQQSTSSNSSRSSVISEKGANVRSQEELKTMSSKVKINYSMDRNIFQEIQDRRQGLQELRYKLPIFQQDIQHFSENKILQTKEYKCLLSKLDAVVDDNLKMNSALNELRKCIQSENQNHELNIIQLNKEGLLKQVELLGGILELRNTLSQERKHYGEVKVDVDTLLVTQDNYIAICQEVEHLKSSLQAYHEHLKQWGEWHRKKYEDINTENVNLQRQIQEVSVTTSSSMRVQNDFYESCVEDRVCEFIIRLTETPDTVMQLQSQIITARNVQREMKMVLDMYENGTNEEQKEKVELMVQDMKCRQELDELKNTFAKLMDDETSELSEDEHLKNRIDCLEKQVNELKKCVMDQKEQQDIIVNGMEFTAQVFEAMQEQNTRLIQMINANADGNYLLDRTMTTVTENLEEIHWLETTATTFSNQVVTLNDEIRRMEEKETGLLQTRVEVELKVELKSQMAEVCKQEEIKKTQKVSDLEQRVQEVQLKTIEFQRITMEKTSELETQVGTSNRLKKELKSVVKQISKIQESDGSSNRMNQMKKELQKYKETLACPCCKVNRNDAILMRCYHMFCFKCLDKRYKARDRYCPTCFTPFGQMDYQYLSL